MDGESRAFWNSLYFKNTMKNMFNSEHEPILAELIVSELELFSPILAAQFRATISTLASDGNHRSEEKAAHDARLEEMQILRQYVEDGTLTDIATLKGVATELARLSDKNAIRAQITKRSDHIRQTRFVGKFAHA